MPFGLHRTAERSLGEAHSRRPPEYSTDLSHLESRVRAHVAGVSPGRDLRAASSRARRMKRNRCDNRVQRPDVHELSVALSIVTTVNEVAVARGFDCIDGVTVAVGELSGIDKNALSFAWDLATAGSPAAGSRLEFRDIALMVKCPSCGLERHPQNAWQSACPTCPAASPQVLAGRELHVIAIEVPNQGP
jgi:hydrogenase nickel incorporation protein HypA/HybF